MTLLRAFPLNAIVFTAPQQHPKHNDNDNDNIIIILTLISMII